MAVLNETFYKGEDIYSDGSIEDEILAFVRSEDYPEKKDEWIGSDFVRAYHLSEIRENILNWYPFRKDASVLEIGAGCGALTGMLCSKVKRVAAVDLSKRRSTINYERNRARDNLELFVGNLEDIRIDEQFDYVVVNGVLEYALSFIKTEDPYADFLRICLRFLKPDGRLLLAIENKLGLKYFNGSMEDHTASYYLGLNNYRGNQTVRTFTERELRKIAARAGFTFREMYYPYPDYKFPNEIFSKEAVSRYHYGRPYSNIEKGKLFLFDEQAVSGMLQKEGIREKFANSFLMEASRVSFEPETVYAKLNSDRKRKFAIGTAIRKEKGTLSVSKFPLTKEAEGHIGEIEKNSRRVVGEKIRYVTGERNGNEVLFPFLDTASLADEMKLLAEESDSRTIIRKIETVFQDFLEGRPGKETNEFYTETFREYFGEETGEKRYYCVQEVNLDLIAENIFPENGYCVIDPEWIYTGWIPVAFIAWRALNELWHKERRIRDKISKEELLQILGIDETESNLFRHWANHFADVFVEGSKRNRLIRPVLPVSLQDAYERERKKVLSEMSLYYAVNGCFAEEQKKYGTFTLREGCFTAVFPLEGLYKNEPMRFDPSEEAGCLCRIDRISSGFTIEAANEDEKREEGDLFYHSDPQYRITTDGNGCFGAGELLVIEGYLEVLSKAATVQNLQKTREEKEKISAEMKKREDHETARREKIRKGEQELLGSLYVDYGEGFSEERKLTCLSVSEDESFAMEFRIKDPKKVKRLRFDFLEGFISSCILDVISPGFYICGHNAIRERAGFFDFLTDDPCFYLKADGKRQILRIEGRCRKLNQEKLALLYR